MKNHLILLAASVFLFTGVLRAQDDTTIDRDGLPSAELPNNDNEPAEGEVGDWKGPSTFIRSHWVRLTKDGGLTGTIKTVDPETGRTFGAEELDVEVYQFGQRKGEGKTDEKGAFTITGLEPGVYSLVARGRTGFLAYGLQLLPSLAEARKDKIKFMQAPRAKESLDITSAAVPPTFRQLKKILQERFPLMQSNFVPEAKVQPELERAIQNMDAGADEPEGAERLRGYKQLDKNGTDPNNTLATTATQVHPVMLSPKNYMYGRLCGIDGNTGRPRKVRDTMVYIIRDDRLVTSAKVDENGFFKVYLRRPDVYSIIAAGKGGFGALSFRAVKSNANADNAQRKPFDPFLLVKAQEDLLDLLDEQNPAPPATDTPADDAADLPESVEGLLGEIDVPESATTEQPAGGLDAEAFGLGDALDAEEEEDADGGLGLLDDAQPQEEDKEDLDASGLQPSFDNFGNPLSAPFCMAIMDDPQVIAQAFRPFVPRLQAQPMAANAGVGGDFIGGAFAPMPVGPVFGGAPAVMGGPGLAPSVAQSAFQPVSSVGTGSYYAGPTYSGGFSSVGGGGASIGAGGGRIGSFLGFAGLTAGVTSVAIRASNRGGMFEPRDPLVSPFTPADIPMMEVDPPIIEEEGEFFLER